MGALKTKIESYGVETGIEFDQAYTLTPTGYGSNTENVGWSLTNTAPTYSSTIGPSGSGAGSWLFSNSSRLRTNSSAWVGTTNNFSDYDYAVGAWVKFNALPGGTADQAMDIFSVTAAGASIGFRIGVSGSSHATNPSKLVLTASNTFVTFTSETVDTNWHYIVFRRLNQSGNNNIEVYYDGSLVYTGTNNATGSFAYLNLGTTLSSTPAWSFYLQNYHHAPCSVLTPTAISEIWAVGSASGSIDVNYTNTSGATASVLMVDPSISTSQNINIIEIPATSSALMVQPTSIVGSGSNTQITTTITASAEFLPNFAVYASQNINITVTETLNASTILGDNITIVTGSDASYSTPAITATAEFVTPVLAIPAMTASALMGNATIYVTPNYYSLVKALNPYLYLYDGKTMTTTTNAGYQTGTLTKGSELLTLQNGGLPLNIVGEGKSWLSSSGYSADSRINFTTTSSNNSFYNLLASGTYSLEFWWNPETDVLKELIDNPYIFITHNKELVAPNTYTRYVYLTIKDSNGTTRYDNKVTKYINANQWHHLVLNMYQTALDPNTRTVSLWIDGSIVIQTTITYPPGTSTEVTGTVAGSYTSGTSQNYYYLDELAVYDQPLSNSNIVNHFQFINTTSPNYIHYASTFDSNAESGNHQFVVNSNVYAIATPITASTNFVMPSVVAQKNINYSASALTASALNTDVTVYWGWTINATPAIASAYQPESYRLSNIYYNYIQTNIAPYRYVSFDHQNPLLDFGTDNDYSVVATVIGGEVVNPDLGINGKSVKTTGSSYVTDGVILKESEWNDTWGTGNNQYSSGFWFQRAQDDASTTGLRVLWNVNGYKDNQHAILYHYQNKLHFQINDQSGTHITLSSVNNVNIFDYNRHFITINSHFNNNHNYITIYVDGVSVITQDIGTYVITTQNSATSLTANDENYNYPRLSVGCLITPFGSTALPVVPTNTKLIIDEIFWDKDQILQTAVTNLYAVMPDKNNKIIVAEPFIATDDFLMPAISTNALYSASAMTSSAELINPSLYIERFITNAAELMEASALMTTAIAFQNAIINSDVMVSTATFNDAGVIITIPGGPMVANAKFENEILWNLLPLTDLTPYIKYLRISSRSTEIYPIREVV